MAPEVLASKKYTETADVYNFAVVCWELLSRACPYEGLNQIQVGGTVCWLFPSQTTTYKVFYSRR